MFSSRWVEWTAVRQHKHRQTEVQVSEARTILQQKQLERTFLRWKDVTKVVRCQRLQTEKAVGHYHRKLCQVALNALILQR